MSSNAIGLVLGFLSIFGALRPDKNGRSEAYGPLAVSESTLTIWPTFVKSGLSVGIEAAIIPMFLSNLFTCQSLPSRPRALYEPTWQKPHRPSSYLGLGQFSARLLVSVLARTDK